MALLAVPMYTPIHSCVAPSQLEVQPVGNESVQLSRLNPCDIFVPSFTYNINAVLVSTGEVVFRQSVLALRNETPMMQLTLDGHACKYINYTISLNNDEGAVSTVEVLPACEHFTAHAIVVFMFIRMAIVQILRLSHKMLKSFLKALLSKWHSL